MEQIPLLCAAWLRDPSWIQGGQTTSSTIWYQPENNKIFNTSLTGILAILTSVHTLHISCVTQKKRGKWLEMVFGPVIDGDLYNLYGISNTQLSFKKQVFRMAQICLSMTVYLSPLWKNAMCIPTIITPLFCASTLLLNVWTDSMSSHMSPVDKFG